MLCSTAHVALLQGEARKIEAALLLPPYYFSKVTDAGLERWLRLILEDSRMPIYLCASTSASQSSSVTCTQGLEGPCTALCGHASPMAMHCVAQISLPLPT